MGHQAAQVGGAGLPVQGGQLRQVLALERQPAREHLEQHHPQAVKVAADVRAQGRGDHLRGNVVARAGHAPLDHRARLVGAPREAQVEQGHVALGRNDDVAGLDVAVPPAGRVECLQGLGHLADHPQGNRQVGRGAGGQSPSQRAAGQPGRDHEVRRLLHAGGQDRDQVGMANGLPEECLAPEKLHRPWIVLPLPAEEFQRVGGGPVGGGMGRSGPVRLGQDSLGRQFDQLPVFHCPR